MNFPQLLNSSIDNRALSQLYYLWQHELLYHLLCISDGYLVLAQQIWNWCTFDFPVRSPAIVVGKAYAMQIPQNIAATQLEALIETSLNGSHSTLL